MNRLLIIVSLTLVLSTIHAQGIDVGVEEGGEHEGTEKGPTPVLPPEHEPTIPQPTRPTGPEEGGPEKKEPSTTQPTIPGGEEGGTITVKPKGPAEGKQPETPKPTLPETATTALKEAQEFVGSKANLSVAPERLSALSDQIRSIEGTSELGLSPDEQVTALTQVLDMVKTTQSAIETEKTKPSKPGEPGQQAPSETQRKGWGSWFWSGTKAVVSTSVSIAASGAALAVDYVLPLFKAGESLELSAQMSRNALQEAIVDSVNSLIFPTAEGDFVTQENLIKRYQEYATTYQLDPSVRQPLDAYAADLSNRRTFAESLSTLQNDVKAVSKTASLADQMAQLAGFHDRAQILNNSKSEATLSLAGQLTGVSRSIDSAFSALADQVSARLDALGKETSITADMLAEAQGLVDRVQDASTFKILGEAKATELREAATSTLATVTKLSQRAQLEALLLGGNFKPFDPTIDTKSSYVDRVQSAYQGIMDLYDETMYDKQSQLLLKLIDAVKGSKGIDRGDQRVLLSMVSDRYREIKNFNAQKAAKASYVNALDEKLDLKSKIPSDQMRAMQGEFLEQSYGIDPTKWPTQAKGEALEVIESYQLFEQNDQANNLQAFLQTPELTQEDLIALAAGSGVASAADVGGNKSGEVEKSVLDGFTDLLSKALKSLQASIGKTLSGLGLWFVNFGTGLRYKGMLEVTAGLGRVGESFVQSVSSFLDQDFIRLNLPVSLASYVENVKATEVVTSLGASTAEALAKKSAWADWLGQKLQSLGDAMVAKGQKLGAGGIDIEALNAKAIAQEAAVRSDASTGSKFKSMIDSWVSQVRDFAQLSFGDYQSRVNKARSDFETARSQFREFLGVDETMSPQQFSRAFKEMVTRVNARGFEDAKGQALLGTKFIILTRALETASHNLAAVYKDAISDSAGITQLFNNTAQTSFDFAVSQAFNASPTVQPTDAITAALGVTATQSGLQGLLVNDLRNSIQSVQDAVSQGLKRAATSPFNPAALDDYTRVLSQLLLVRQNEAANSFAQARSQIQTRVAEFTKKVGTSS